MTVRTLRCRRCGEAIGLASGRSRADARRFADHLRSRYDCQQAYLAAVLRVSGLHLEDFVETVCGAVDSNG